MPDLNDPTVPVDVATLAVRSAMAWAMDQMSYFRPILADISLVTVVPDHVVSKPKKKVKKQVEDAVTGGTITVTEYVDDIDDSDEDQSNELSPAVWATTWHPGTGPGMKNMRLNAIGPLSKSLGTSVVVDHRLNGGDGLILIGALDEVETTYTPESGIETQYVKNLMTEDYWTVCWTEVLKVGANQPAIKHKNFTEASLKDGVVIYKQMFTVPRGWSPADFMGLDDKIATVRNSAPFVYVGWRHIQAAVGKPPVRPGERHPGVIDVYWTEKEVPVTPQALEPAHGQAPKWLLSGMVGKAFRSAKLDQPELLTARPLTTLRSDQHLWKIDLRLYGKETLTTVRAAVSKLQSALGVPYVRVADHAEGVTLVIGAKPEDVRIANPADTGYLIGLDWQASWMSGKIVNVNGELPMLAKSSVLPNNPKVQQLDFDLPVGLDFSRVRSAKSVLATGTGNEFLEVLKIEGEPSMVRLMVAKTNPLRNSIPYDWKVIDSSEGFTFATGIDGAPVAFDPEVDPHLLVVGGTGSGKSVLLQSLIYSAFVHGSEVWIADPVKGANDFSFATPYAKLVTKDYFETAEMMKEIVAESDRRKSLLGDYSVGNFLDLPDEVRPCRLVAILDEFTSLIQTDTPYTIKEMGDDPELEDENDAILALNKAKLQTGKNAARLIREARAFGITIIIATQKMTAEDASVIGKDLKTNMSRILAGATTLGDRMSALKDPLGAPDLGTAVPKGRALFESQASSCAIVQTWFEPGGQKELTAKLQERISTLEPSEKFIPVCSQPKKPAGPKFIDLDDIEVSMDDLFADDAPKASTTSVEQLSSAAFEVIPVAPVFAPAPVAPVFVSEKPRIVVAPNFFDIPDDDDENNDDSDEEVFVTVPVIPEPVAVVEVPVVRKAPAQSPQASRRSHPDSLVESQGGRNPFEFFETRREAPAEDNPFA
jgi:hypothetical protein